MARHWRCIRRRRMERPGETHGFCPVFRGNVSVLRAYRAGGRRTVGPYNVPVRGDWSGRRIFHYQLDDPLRRHGGRARKRLSGGNEAARDGPCRACADPPVHAAFRARAACFSGRHGMDGECPWRSARGADRVRPFTRRGARPSAVRRIGAGSRTKAGPVRPDSTRARRAGPRRGYRSARVHRGPHIGVWLQPEQGGGAGHEPAAAG